MKKTFCVFLAMLMLTGLCACGNSSTPGDGSSAPAETAAQEAADVEYSILVTDTPPYFRRRKEPIRSMS